MLEKLYRLLWSKTTGRPFTYIMRESASRKPYTWMIMMFFLGLLMGSWMLQGSSVGAVAVSVIAMVISHLFWDSRGSHHKGPEGFR